MHEQVARMQILARIIAAAIEAIVVEDMQRDLLLAQKIEESGIEIHLPEQIETVHILHRDGLLLPGRILDGDRIMFPPDAPIREYVVVFHGRNRFIPNKVLDRRIACRSASARILSAGSAFPAQPARRPVPARLPPPAPASGRPPAGDAASGSL